MRFSPISKARSPRIVPGAASLGFVAPMRVRTTLYVSPGPSLTEERLVRVLAVVGLGDLASDGPQLGGHDRETLALKASDDLSGETALYAVRLHDDKGPIHEGRP